MPDLYQCDELRAIYAEDGATYTTLAEHYTHSRTLGDGWGKINNAQRKAIPG